MSNRKGEWGDEPLQRPLFPMHKVFTVDELDVLLDKLGQPIRKYLQGSTVEGTITLHVDAFVLLSQCVEHLIDRNQQEK